MQIIKMKIEKRRVFISDLPENISESDLEQEFQNYGAVSSVEIRQRKELGPKNQLPYFAYVNIEVDDCTLQRCFEEISSKKWNGHYLSLQIARESFLEKLKREREEKKASDNTKENQSVPIPVTNGTNKSLINEAKSLPILKRKYASSSSEESDSEINVPNEPIVKSKTISKKNKSSSSEDSEDENVQRKNATLDSEENAIIIKNNRNKVLVGKTLKIESQGFEPILKIDLSKKKSKNTSEAEQKRLKSLTQMKQDYQKQKNLLKDALSNIDQRPKNKIIFNDSDNEDATKNETFTENNTQEYSNRFSLFDDDDENDEAEEYNFNVKQQFEGEKGKKLYELQSKTKKDKRFVMDERYLEDDDDDNAKNENDSHVSDKNITIEQEKLKELEILGKVLGRKVTPNANAKKANAPPNYMLRYDPSNPEHSVYEMKESKTDEPSSKRKRKLSGSDEKKAEEEVPLPEVSKEKFYQVTADLKKALQTKESFSLLNMFGSAHVEEDKEEDNQIPERPEPITKKAPQQDRNPFKYDSSDDEMETVSKNKEQNFRKNAHNAQNSFPARTWHEPFFFCDDDYRFQEGRDFIEQVLNVNKDRTEFLQLRKDLKKIVKSKVKHVSRKNAPFKKKLGSSRKKFIKKKKVFKRK